MANTQYGYVQGPRNLMRYRVDSTTAAIVVGDMVSLATAGYCQQISAGELPLGVAFEAVASPAADGDASILVDISEESVYRYPPDAGSATVALIGTTMDVGGAQSIDIDASTDDCILVVDVDAVANEILVQMIRKPAGVV